MTAWRGWALASLLAGGLIGCVRNAPPTAPPPALAPLPAKALTALADLTPPVARPSRRPPARPAEPRAVEPFEKAVRLIASGQRMAATGELEKALGYAPNDPAVRRLLGLCYLDIGADAKAAPHLRAVADTAGDDARVQVALARVAYSAGRPDEALLRYRTALQCSDGPAAAATNEALYVLGTLLHQRGFTTAALTCYDRLAANIERYGDRFDRVPALRRLLEQPELLLHARGRLQMDLRHYDKAADLLDAAYRQNKAFPAASTLLVDALVAGRRFERAEQVLLEFLGSPASRGAAREAIVAVYRARNDPAGPGRLLDAYKARDPNPSADVVLACAAAARTVGGVDDGMAVLAGHVDGMAGEASVVTQLATWQFRRGQADAALDRLTTLLARNSDAAEAVAACVDGAPAGGFSADLARERAAAARADASAARYARHYMAGLIARRARVELLADEQFREAIRANVKFVPAYEALVRNCIDRKEYDRAMAIIDRVRTKAGDPAAGRFLLGWAQLETGQADRAAQTLSEVVAADGANVRARVLLARAYLRTGRLDDAERQLIDAVAVQPDEQAYEMIVSLYLLRYEQTRDIRGMAEARPWLGKARTFVSRLLQTDQDNATGLRLLVQIHRMSGQYLMAREAMARLFAVAPDDVETRLLRVRLEARAALLFERMGRRRFERVEADLTAALTSDPGNVDALVLLAEAYAARERYADAAGALAEARRRRPNDADLALRHATALANAKRLDEAADVMAKVVAPSEASASVTVRLAYVSILCRAGRAEQALGPLARWAAKAEQEEALTYELAAANARARAGQFKAAHAELDKLLARQGRPQVRHMVRAEHMAAYAAAEDFDALEAEAVRWLALATPEHWLARVASKVSLPNLMAELALGFEPPERRVRRGGLVRAASPIQLAIAWLCNLGQFDRAETFALAQIAQYGAKGDRHAELASTWRVALVRQLVSYGRRAQAERLYERFLREDENNVELLGLAQLLYTDQAPATVAKVAALLERAVKMAPSDGMLVNNLGYLWADAGIQLDQAERLIRASLAIEAQPNVQDSMGWLLYKKGRFEAARDYLLLAFNSPEGDNAVVYDHLGDIYWRLGRVTEAIETWTEAADLAEVALQREGDLLDADTRRTAEQAPRKVAAAKAGKQPPVAPLGEGSKPGPEGAN